MFPHEHFIVSDLRKDERFKDHPLVKGDPQIVFLAGIPLTNPQGFALGTLCILDKRPRILSDSQLKALKILSRQIIHLLELRKANLRLSSLKSDLEARNEELQQFAFVVSHDIKSPLASIILTSEMLRENFGENIDEDNDQLLKVLGRASLKIRDLVDGVLAYYRSESALSENAELFELRPFLFSIAEMFKTNQAVDIRIPQEDRHLFMNKTALEQIFVNLIQNALKYNDKEKPIVQIGFSEDDTFYCFVVTDNGKGIAPEEQQKIFEVFKTLGQRDRFGIQGSGIGLSTVKKLVEKLSGGIDLKSVQGQGTEFSFSIKKQK
jgi:signal transduction histidine kinase